MPAAPAYLDWLTDVFDEAQVPYSPETAAWLDASLRKISGTEGQDEEAVYRKLRARWLNHGLPGRQLLAGFLRDEVFARRDSPIRPTEGGAYFTNDYRTQAMPPVLDRR